MTEQLADRRLMRLLAAVLVVLWAAIAIAVASAYRPGGPIDIIVAAACFIPVVIADAGVVWPASGLTRRHRLALVWVWIAAMLFAIPVLYGVAIRLAEGGPQSLVPSFEEGYAAALSLLALSFFSVVGWVHIRRGVRPLERRASWATVGLSVILTVVVGFAFVLVAVINDQALRRDEPAHSRFGPTDPDIEPPFCDEPVALGTDARIRIEAESSLDNEDRGIAVLEGQRSGLDESWGGSWEGPDGSGRQAYLRVGRLAWLNGSSDDAGAPLRMWRDVEPDPFGMLGSARLTMDGPPHAIADLPRGEIVPEDLGLVVVEGARARHCRTFIDGPTALRTFLPLRWLLLDSSFAGEDVITRWRGELDWWVFADGELGMASAEVSGSPAETPWDADGVRVVLEARLEATDRDRPVDVGAPTATGHDARSSPVGAAPEPTLESGTP